MAARSGSPLADLLVVFALVFLVQLVTAATGVLEGLFVLAPPLAEHPWTIVTSVYAHAGVGHLVSNAVALVLFGWPVARATTRARFHAFFLATGALAGVSQILLSHLAAETPVLGDALSALPGVTVAATGGVLGASGAVFGLLGYLLAANRLSAGLFARIHLPRWLTLAAFVTVAGLVTLATAEPGVAVIAHFTGLFVGLLAGRLGVLDPR